MGSFVQGAPRQDMAGGGGGFAPSGMFNFDDEGGSFGGGPLSEDRSFGDGPISEDRAFGETSTMDAGPSTGGDDSFVQELMDSDDEGAKDESK